ncbi:MAG: hypothetical protein ACREQA_08560, partial [Candidatus Binatia bacterium]
EKDSDSAFSSLAMGERAPGPDGLLPGQKHQGCGGLYRGEELEAMAKEVIVQPPEVVEGMKRLMAK